MEAIMTQNMPVPFKILGKYDKQKFIQFNPEDTANWYLAYSDNGKNKVAMYPVAGRRHIRFLNINRLIFDNEPRGLFNTIDYYYVVDGSNIYRIDANYNQVLISGGLVTTSTTNIYFCYLIITTITFAVFVDGQNIYIYREDTGVFTVVTDPNAPPKPTFCATYGNRITVSSENSSQFSLSQVNLGGSGYDPSTVFTIAGSAVIAQEDGIIRQFAVLKNILYIFTDYTTGIWFNQASFFSGTGTTFPWKKNASYAWDYGIEDPQSLDVSFGRMTWLGQNADGLVQVLSTMGGDPKPISTKAIELLFQRNAVENITSPFLQFDAQGFLYQLDDTVLYRLSAGPYNNTGIINLASMSNAIEYNYDTDSWHRVIELNGQRNRINKHIYFNNMHLVTLEGDTTIYEMSDQFYDNETENPLQPDPLAIDGYTRYPFRYERKTPIIREDDDAQFITDWVQIDFVWGDHTFIRNCTPFSNTQFIIDEKPDSSGNPIFMVAEDNPNQFMITENSNYPQPDEKTYCDLYKPHIELYWSDDGGISFLPADVLEFSQLGFYQWRMRWYQLGVSINRVYYLVCVSPAPIVVLGGLMSVRRVSGGAS
jgi:hypothetical protein